MDREKKRKIAVIVLVFMGVLAIGFIWLWNNYLNRGTLVVTAKAPFTVEIYGGENYQCDQDQCAIKESRGLKDLIISKEGYRVVVAEAEVLLWDEVELDVDFELIPFIEETEEFPEDLVIPEYDLVMDEDNGVQKLVVADDERQEAIVIFQNVIEDWKIVAGENGILVIDVQNPEQAYKIDVRGRERNVVSNEALVDLVEGKWSNNGQYLVFSREESGNLWLIDVENEVQELELDVGLDQVTWTYTNNLMFVTDKAVAEEIRIGNYSGYITLGEDVSVEGITFGEYHPDEKSYTRIMTFEDNLQLPSDLVPTSNGGAIFFRSGGVNYKVVVSN